MARTIDVKEIRPGLHGPYYCDVSGVYAIINSENGKVYIGSAVHLNRRWNVHRCNFSRGRHNEFILNDFNENPGCFYIEVIEEMPLASVPELKSREQFWIDFYQSYNREFGYNVQPKSDSPAGTKYGPKHLKNLSERMKKFWKTRVLTPEDRKRMSDAHKGHKGRVFTPEQRLQQSLRLTGRKISPELSKKFSELRRGKKLPSKGRPVIQFDRNGVEIKRFQAIAYAALETGRKECNIRAACKQKQKKSGGCYWRFEDELPSGCKQIEIIQNGHCRPLVQLTLNGEYIQSFSKPSLAAKATGISNVAIGQACRGASKSSGGFKWRYL